MIILFVFQRIEVIPGTFWSYLVQQLKWHVLHKGYTEGWERVSAYQLKCMENEKSESAKLNIILL